MPLSERCYVADAVFVAGVEGEREFIHGLHAAVREPVFFPYLGRRSCPPSGPVDLGVREDVDLIGALEQAPWQASEWYRARTAGSRQELTLLIDSPPDRTPDYSLRDEPISFDPHHRLYGLRGITSRKVQLPDQAPASPSPHHDPTSGLGAV